MPDLAPRRYLLESPTRVRIINPHRQVITDGLVGWWVGPNTPGSGTTTVPDESGNGNDAALTNHEEEDWVTGRIDGTYALNVDDAERQVVANDASLNSSAISVMAWIDLDDLSPSSNAYILARYEFSANKRMWAFILNIAEDFRIVTSTDGTTVSNADIGQAPESGWHHVAIVTANSGDTWQFFYDGSLEGTYTDTDGYGDLGSHFSFGGLDNSTSFANGRYQDVRYYNRALIADEIAAIVAGKG